MTRANNLELAEKITDQFKNCKQLYLDVGNTMLFPKQSPGLVYAKIAAEFGLVANPEVLKQAFKTYWQTTVEWRYQKNQGQCSEALLQEFWQRLVNQCFEHAKLRLPRAAFKKIYEYYAQAAAWDVNQPILACVQSLLQQGWQVGLLSNWDFRLPTILQQLGINHYFSPCIFSAKAGWEKPHPKIYELAIQKAKVKATHILMIGDSLVNDVQTPKAMGMHALHLKDWLEN